MHKKIKNKGGFSIAEVMISSFVLVVGLTAIISLLIENIKQSSDVRSSIIASQLAQEGVELVRNIRDNNLVNRDDFLNNLPDSNEDDCIIDAVYGLNKGNGPSTCGSYDTKLYMNNSLGFYGHSGSTYSGFRRKIIFSDYRDSSGDGIVDNFSIVSMVVWNINASSFPSLSDCNSGNKCTYVKDLLTDH